MCVFISQDFLVSPTLSYLPLKSLLYISTQPICGIDGFLLTFVLTLLSESISIYYPCVSAGPLQHNRSIIGGWWRTAGLKAHTGVAVRCCFLGGSVWTLTSKAVQLCEAPSCSSSQKPCVGSLHNTPRLLSLLPPPFPSSFSVSHQHHHHIHGKGSAPASCSTITSPNPPPYVCISAVLIAPETQSNVQEMRAGVQLTGSPLFPFPLLPGIPFTSALVLKDLCGLLRSP